jgi:hypothetical protein
MEQGLLCLRASPRSAHSASPSDRGRHARLDQVLQIPWRCLDAEEFSGSHTYEQAHAMAMEDLLHCRVEGEPNALQYKALTTLLAAKLLSSGREMVQFTGR